MCDIHRQEIEIERGLSMLVNDPIFAKYKQVFDQFGFGSRVRSLILSTIYPIQAYLDKNGKPLVENVLNLVHPSVIGHWQALD
ncbi:hypothetical protein [Synechococcus sp. PCC 7502]|uniref:hypothetical protein n=1 Tax=Synechococcus sp. PCC 7502 TaxID=1173263 RepID=UPI0006856F0E|nr:hypothetical protein [Synechococcus sp. PCC 7502]